MKFNSIKFPYPVLNIQQYPMSPRTQDQIFIILFWPQRSGKNLWKAARIFCKTAIKGCRNLQTLHSIPSYFPRSRYLPLSFLALSSFASVLFDRTRVFFEKRYHDIPAVSILHLPTSLVFSPFFFFFFKVLPSLFLPIDARRPLLDISPPLSPLFCPLFFLPLSSTLAPTLYSFFFSLPRFSTPLNVHDSKDFHKPSIFRIWSFLLFNTHTSFSDRRPPGSPDISPSILGVHKGQVPPQQVSCLQASKGVAWISYSWRGPAELIYLSRRGN